jgi:hypothetical protein
MQAERRFVIAAWMAWRSLGGFDRAFDDALYSGPLLVPLWMGVSVNELPEIVTQEIPNYAVRRLILCRN